MTEPTITRVPGGRVELAFCVTPDEATPYIEQAAADLQNAKPLKGFRPGKAPLAAVKAEFGDMRLLEAALERIVRAKYVHALLEQGIETVGSPEIRVDQLTPGAEIKFTATAPVMPTVEKLADYNRTIITKHIQAVDDASVERALQDLCNMRRKEVITDDAASKDGMVEIDMVMKKNDVVIEDGTASKYRIYLNETHYIPGFTDQLVGLKRGDTKTFELPMPEEHYNKALAGKPLTFTVTVRDVYTLTLPELNDAFAAELGVDTLAALRDKITTNMKEEAAQRAEESAEIELLESLIKESRFSEIPELLINEEVRRMFDELTHAVEAQGMNVNDYFTQLKKSPDEVKLDMVPRAIERVKTAVLIRAVATKEQIAVSDTDLDAEIDRILEGVKEPDTRSRVASPEYRDYLARQMKNHKTVALLREKAIVLKS